MNFSYQQLPKLSKTLSTTPALLALALVSSLVFTACNDSETAFIADAADNTPTDQEAVEPEDNEAGGGRTGQEISNRDCDSAGTLPLDGITGLTVLSSARPDATAEVLALESGDGVIASEAQYLRISGELAALRSAYPNRTNIEATPCHPSRIIAELGDSLASTELFDAYNTLLRSQLALLGDGKTVIISVDGIYNMNTLAVQYEALPNINFATPDTFRGDGSDICLEEIANGGHLYIFDQAADDCPSGCTAHNYSGFTVDNNGNIRDLGNFEAQSDTAEPAWFSGAAYCRNYL